MEELNIKEVEVSRINLTPGDILVAKIYMDDTSEADLADLKSKLNIIFPKNKIMLFALPNGGKVEFDVLDAAPKAAKQSYCSDCNCGKKMAMETLNEQGK